MPSSAVRLLTVLVLAGLTATVQEHAAFADDGNAGLTPLAGEASRTQLFETVKQARLTSDHKDNVVGFPFKGDFSFPTDTTYDDIARKPRDPDIVFGIDLSHYSSSELDLRLLRQQNVAFVYVKATQGVQFYDAHFTGFWQGLGKLPMARKVFRGAYHFLSAKLDGKRQADRYVDYVTSQGGFKADDMPPCVDLEWDRMPSNPDAWRGTSAKQIVDETLAWLTEVATRTGRVPMIYTARSWWAGVVPQTADAAAQFARLQQYPIWVADYSRSGRFTESPGVPGRRAWDLWQFTDASALQSGYPDQLRLDASVHKGPLPVFLASLGVKTGPADAAGAATTEHPR